MTTVIIIAVLLILIMTLLIINHTGALATKSRVTKLPTSLKLYYK